MGDIDQGRAAPDRTRASEAPAIAVGEVADIDLTGVDPMHWADTRERVAILRAWCASGRHPRSDALAAAARMGTSVSHFYRLVAAWKKHREARLVSGHTARRGEERGPRASQREAHGIMQRVIGERGPDARFVDVLADVRTACDAASLQAPSSGIVHRQLMRERQSRAGDAREPRDDVAVAAVACLLPVRVDGRTVATPGLVLAVERPGGAILGHRLALDGDAASAARAVISDLIGKGTGPIIVSRGLGAAVDHADPDATTSAGDTCVEVSGRSALLSTTLGSYLDSVPIRHRRVAADAPGSWRPLSPADAVAAIDLAVATHNAAKQR